MAFLKEMPMCRKNADRTFLVLQALLVAVCMCFGCNDSDSGTPEDAAAPSIEPGIWEISGIDSLNGPFTGSLEMRETSSGVFEVIRLIRVHDWTYKDGRTIELAWTGTGEKKAVDKALVRFSLTRADFIPYVETISRTEADRTPLVVTASATASRGRGLDLVYSTDEDPGWTIEEEGVFVSSPGSEPLFKMDREVHATHPEANPLGKEVLFKLFESYHALPEVEPYVDNPDFQKAVHYQVVERTDSDYYRSHPDRLRVVNKVLDAVSLAETEIRANAFRAPFHEKAAYYQEELTRLFLGPHGMVENRNDQGKPEPDGDGALWTGVYGYTQALRYRATGEPQALDDLRAVVRGIHTLIDITGDPLNFARTLRLADLPLPVGWRQGEGPFAELYWLPGGNNDMAQGVIIGMIAGWDALPQEDPLRPEIAAHSLKLLDLCEFMQERDAGCPARDGLDLPSTNPGMALLLAGITNDDPDRVGEGLAWLNDCLLKAYAELGGGPFYIHGISDWSGNHLTLVSTLSVQWLLNHTDDEALKDLWLKASGKAWQNLRTLEHPLQAALASGLHALDDPGDQEEARAQALWGLRSFPFPKHSYPVDHRIRADFVLSPYPSLPWKMDWETDRGRMQSLTGHGLVESVVDQYFWNGSVLSIAEGAIGPGQAPGGDYLFLYWLARDLNLIGPSE